MPMFPAKHFEPAVSTQSPFPCWRFIHSQPLPWDYPLHHPIPAALLKVISDLRVLNPNVHSHSLSCLTSQNPLMHYPWKALFTASLLSLISSTIHVLLFFLVPFPTFHSWIVTAIRDCSGPSFLSSCALSLSHSVLNQHGIKCLLETLPFSSQSWSYLTWMPNKCPKLYPEHNSWFLTTSSSSCRWHTVGNPFLTSVFPHI